jgi:hypothetical protein
MTDTQQEPHEIVVEAPMALVAPTPRALTHNADDIDVLLQMAVDKDLDIAKLKELIALREHVEDRNAAREFFDAMAAFQAECPPAPKNKTAKFATKSGAEMSYKYAELDVVAKHVAPYLHKHGLSYSWDTKIEGNYLTVICHVRHRSGHTVPSSTVLPVDNPSAMSPAQKVGAAMTFGQRKTLCQSLGITTGEPDTDGVAIDHSPRVTQDQADTIAEVMESNGTNKARFMKWLGVEKLTDLPAARYDGVLAELERVRKAKEAKADRSEGT